MAPAPGELSDLRGRCHNTPIETAPRWAAPCFLSLTFRAGLYPLIAGRRRAPRRQTIERPARAACWPTSPIAANDGARAFGANAGAAAASFRYGVIAKQAALKDQRNSPRVTYLCSESSRARRSTATAASADFGQGKQ